MFGAVVTTELISLPLVPAHSRLPWLKRYPFLVHITWSSGSWRAIVYLFWCPKCCRSLLGHDPGSYTCAAGTRMSTVHDMLSAQTSAHHATRVWSVEIWVMNVLAMPPLLGPLDIPQGTMLPPAGFIITLTLPCVLMAVTTSAMSWNDWSTLEQMQRRFAKMS